MDMREQAGFITGSPAPTAEERQWGMIAHLSALVASVVGFPLLGPLIVWLTKGKESAWVEQHAKEALNFQITVTAALWISAFLMICIVGIFMLPVIGLAALVLTVMAGIKANNGEMYRYPATIRLVK
jgi:uncharacterized Tic20 family protein